MLGGIRKEKRALEAMCCLIVEAVAVAEGQPCSQSQHQALQSRLPEEPTRGKEGHVQVRSDRADGCVHDGFHHGSYLWLVTAPGVCLEVVGPRCGHVGRHKATRARWPCKKEGGISCKANRLRTAQHCENSLESRINRWDGGIRDRR